MADFKWNPDGFLALMLEEIPDYVALQEQVAAATGSGARRVLELGTGTGETASRVLARHPDAAYVGVDSSADMLVRARERLAGVDVTLHDGALEDPLPAGEFDVVVSVLAVHHLDGPGKAALFARVAAALAGRRAVRARRPCRAGGPGRRPDRDRRRLRRPEPAG